MGTVTGLDLRSWLLSGKPTGTYFETTPRDGVNIDQAVGATGVMLTAALPVTQGSVLTKVTMAVGATAASTPTHGFVALYGPGATVQPLLVQSADQLTTAMAANTFYTWSFTTPYTAPTTDVYYVGISFTGTTIPTLLGKAQGLNATNIIAFLAAFTTAAPLAQTSGTALGGVAPATVATPTNVLTIPWLLVQ
jgi:hypothetical protein